MEEQKSAILIEGIGKRFNANPRESEIKKGVGQTLLSWFKRRKKESLWALSNMSFSIERGEVVGIVGNNGAGKSVLFKILARIMKPTTGRATVNGSLIAMLEINDSFYMDLTGRENVFISAATYGMGLVEIKKVMDDILQISEIGSFINAPVKRYSSGMRTKLAFAIAMMMQPDIIILDEILSVSDVSFRKKSLDLLRQQNIEMKQTQLLVSHDLNIIKDFCTKVIWLESGTVKKIGDTSVIAEYIANKESNRNEII